MKLTLSALLTFAASASAFLLDTPDVWYADERATERWQWQGGLPDPAQFDLLLVNNNSNWDLANNVRTVDEEVSFKVPDVPAGHYYLRAVDTNNHIKIYAQTTTFDIVSGNEN